MLSCRYDYFDISCLSIKDDVIIITENVDGEKYILVANTIYTILDDWEGECEYVPENDAPVYFSMECGIIISSEYNTFEKLMGYFLMLRHDDC